MTAQCIRVAMILATGLTIIRCGDGTAPSAGCRDESGTPLPTSPPSARVDLRRPSFSDPTSVTNPLLPIGRLSRTVLLGTADGLPLRVETTLLPYTRSIEWNGEEVETLVSQFVSFLDGRILEVAIDWYAQADDGSVWYLGEDVFNYANGVVLDTEGTWLAGEDGPAGMIMAAVPQVGNVWRPENICGVVFEEVTVASTGVTVAGPRGPVPGAIVVQELHMDAALEPKIFAPGYGEFRSGSGADLEALALAVPTDALSGPTPARLLSLDRAAAAVFDAAAAGDWAAASAAVDTITLAWTAFSAGGVPPLLDAQMDDAVVTLAAAVDGSQRAAARQASIAVARAGLDVQLQYRPRAEVDLGLLDLWVRQLLVDSEANDLAAVVGDVATLLWIRERLVQDAFEPSLRLVDARLREVRAAVSARALGAASDAAVRLRQALATVR